MGERRATGGGSAYVLMAAWLTFAWPRCALPAAFPVTGDALRLALSRDLEARTEQSESSPEPEPATGDALHLTLTDTLAEQQPPGEGGIPGPAYPAAANGAGVESPAPGNGDVGAGTGEEGSGPGKSKGLFEKIKGLVPWRLSPIRTWGSVGYTFRSEDIGTQKTRDQLLTATLNGSSFIWRPWFALVSGGIGISQDWTSGTQGGSSRDLTGNASLALLPESRFPFEAHYNVTDSRMDTGLAGTIGAAYRYKRLGFSQTYQTLQGNTRYRLAFDQSSQTGESGTVGDYQQNGLQFGASTRFGKQSVDVSGTTNKNERLDTGETALLNTLDVRHNYTPNQEFSVDSQATLNDNRYNLATTGTNTRFLQLNSYAFWRPERSPLTVNGGVRLYALDTGPTSLRSANLNGGAIYRLNRNVSLNATANLTQTASGGITSTSTNQSLGATYQSGTLNFGKYQYYWFGSGTASNRTGLAAGRHLSLAAGHGLSRSIETGPGARLAMNLSQSISSDLDTAVASTRRLSDTASLTWNKGADKTSTLLRLSATDSRSLNDGRDVMQMINFQATVNTLLNRYSSLSGDLTIQSSRQSTIDQPISQFTTSSSGDLTYRHQRAFGVPRLQFMSQLTLYGQVALPVLSGPQEYETRSWENRLNYSIGRTQLGLIARVGQFGNQTHTSIMFNAIRNFGDM